jgi:hypothetical protein
VLVTLSDVEAARAALDALGLGAGERPLQVPLHRGVASIGADGVSVPAFLRSRFIPYSKIAAVAESPTGVTLTLDDGAIVTLRLSDQVLDDAAQITAREAHERRAMIVDRIGQARERAGNARVPEAKLARLDRAGRSIEAWSEALSSLSNADYRHEPFTADELTRIALDGEAAPARRVAATVALRVAKEPALERVRIAADACLDRDLKRALEQAAEGELELEQVSRIEKRARES